MAKKLSKRQRQKAKQKQVNTLKKQGYSAKQISQLSNEEINKQYKHIVTEKRKQEKRKNLFKKQSESRAKKLDWKRNSLEALGFNPKYATRVKYDDIEAYKRGEDYRLSIEKYPFLYDSNGFDFEKVYHFPNGKGLYIAWLDYSGESTIEELMHHFSKFSNETLIEFLQGILETPKQHNTSDKNSGSSGRAGTFRSMITTDNVAEKMLKSDNDALKKSFSNTKKRRYHTGVNRYYQNITENGKPTIKSITGRELLIILNAIMYNVTEDSRDMYTGIYKSITNQIPDFKLILPKP